MRDEMTIAQLATLTGRPDSTVSDWTRHGLASRKSGRNRVVKTVDLIRFLAGDATPAEITSQRERLAKEQADKIALENAQKRGELVLVGQVAEVFSMLAAELAARHDAVPGRVATEFAGITDAAVIRQRLLDELREVRTAVADAVEKFADSLGTDV